MRRFKCLWLALALATSGAVLAALDVPVADAGGRPPCHCCGNRGCSWRGQYFVVNVCDNCERHVAAREAQHQAALRAQWEAQCRAAAVGLLKETQARRADAKALLDTAFKAVIGDLSDLRPVKEAAAGAEAAASASRAAERQICRGIPINEAAPADKVAGEAANDAAAAIALFRAAEEAASTKPALEKWLTDVRSEALATMHFARLLLERAPKALEVYGAFEGGVKDKYTTSYTAIRLRAAQAYRLLRVAQAFEMATLSPKDDDASKHLVALQSRKAHEAVRSFISSPADPDKEVDKDLDNLSLKELGVKGGDKGDDDSKNLETPFDKAKEAVQKLQRLGLRYLDAAATLFGEGYQDKAPPMRKRFQDVMAQVKAGLRGIIEAITMIQKSQQG